MNRLLTRTQLTLSIIGSALLAAAMGGCAPASTPTATVTPTYTPEIPIPVYPWLTTTDQTKLLEPQPATAFGTQTGTGKVIYVNENHPYQTMDGFGASMTDSSAWLIYTQLSEKQRDGVMTALFSAADGIGMGALRLPMGASDFVNGEAYTYDDLPRGETDPDLVNFSIEHDQAYIIPALQDALKINPDLKIIASPWSPPGWMKDTDSLLHGTLRKEYYAAFADYFVKFLQAYQAEGIPIYAITLQNEPQFEPGSYPGMRLEPADEADLVKNYFAPAFSAAGIDSKILIWDHNWDQWEYPIEVLNDPQAKQYIGGSAFHCYAGSVIAQGMVHDAHPDKDIFFTECSGGGWINDWTAALQGDFKNLVIGATRNWAKTVIKWNLALDRSYGPHRGGCGNCYGIVTIDPETESGYIPQADYYSLGHAGKFVAAGARRIASSSYPYENLESVAFENPDGSNVLIVFASGGPDQSITVVWGDRNFSYPLPGGTAATFVWDGEQTNGAAPAPPNPPSARFSGDKVIVTWEFSPLADTYTVKRAGQAGGPYTVLATGTGIPEYFDAEIEPGQTYYYIVSAANGLGESGDSAEAIAYP